jgi:hypothetical protein
MGVKLRAVSCSIGTRLGRIRFGGADVPAEQRLADLESSLVQVKLDPAENAAPRPLAGYNVVAAVPLNP